MCATPKKIYGYLILQLHWGVVLKLDFLNVLSRKIKSLFGVRACEREYNFIYPWINNYIFISYYIATFIIILFNLLGVGSLDYMFVTGVLMAGIILWFLKFLFSNIPQVVSKLIRREILIPNSNIIKPNKVKTSTDSVTFIKILEKEFNSKPQWLFCAFSLFIGLHIMNKLNLYSYLYSYCIIIHLVYQYSLIILHFYI